MIPTVGFNMKKVSRGNVTIKLWDIGGQPRFRSIWERYCRGVNAIVYVVDAADEEKFETQQITGREVCCYSISCLEKKNIDLTLDW